jgi:hypothetical protein
MIWCAGGGAQVIWQRFYCNTDAACRDFAGPARAYHNESSAGGESGATVIDDTMAERMVTCGWVAASAAGVFLIALAFMAGFRVGWLYLAGAAVLLVLAYGVYRRSRICAVLVLVNHVLGFAGLFTSVSDVPPIELAVTLVLAILYALGVIGSFVHHARRRAPA